MAQPDKPEAGWYKTRLTRGGPWVPVRIWFDFPPDPDHPGEKLDRSPRWQCLVDNKEADPYVYWPWVIDHRITEAQYNAMILGKRWDALHDPGSPSLDPERPIDLMRIRPPF